LRITVSCARLLKALATALAAAGWRPASRARGAAMALYASTPQPQRALPGRFSS
jgi:hypothetical protein